MNRPQTSPPPWYKQRGPWLLMLGPALAVVAGLFTAWLAVVSDDGLVADDYSKQGKEISMDLARDKQARQLGLSAQLMLSPGQREVRLLLSGGDPASAPPQLTLRLNHPTRSGHDQVVLLKPIGGAFYSGQLPQALAPAPHWLLQLDGGQWRLRGQWKVKSGDSVSLQPLAAAQ